MDTLNVCILTQQYGNVHSGVGTYATYLIDNLAKKGHIVTVVCPENDPERNFNINFFKTTRFKHDPSPNNWISVSRDFAKTLKKIHENERFDIVHFTDARESLFYSKTETTTIGTVHDFYSAIAPKNPIWYIKNYPQDWWKRYLYFNANKFLEKRAFSKMDKLISVCKYTADKISEKYRINHDKIQIVYNGIDINKYDIIKKIYKKESDGVPRILFVGGNAYRKNLLLLIKSSPAIIKEYPDTMFYVVGKDSRIIHLQKLAKNLNVDKNFVFLGYITDSALLQLYATSNIFVMPSLYESFAFVFLESMALGTPVIAGNVGGSTELINHGKNGFLVNPYDHDELTKYIIKLMDDTELWKNVSKNGIVTTKKFSVEDMVEKTIDIYHQFLK